ncbi:MAG: 6-carboxytetrahydropterin synthase QueD [Elusimicrobiota bacterium]
MKYEVSVVRTFSAAHALRGYRGKCENLHGHNWRVVVSVSGYGLGKTGMLLDFTDLKSFVELVLAELDHKNLNDVSPFNKINPTAENIAAYICVELKKQLPSGVSLSNVEVWESETSSARCSFTENEGKDGITAVDTGAQESRIKKRINDLKKTVYYAATLTVLIILGFAAATFVRFNVLGQRNSNEAVLKQAREAKIDCRDVIKNPGKYTGKPVEWRCRYLSGSKGIIAGSDVQIEIQGIKTSNVKTGKMFAYTVLGKIVSVHDNIITVEGIDLYQTE